MFLAIINDTYSEVKADFSVIPSTEFEISDLIRQVSTSVFWSEHTLSNRSDSFSI